jgi:hypothetical protein
LLIIIGLSLETGAQVQKRFGIVKKKEVQSQIFFILKMKKIILKSSCKALL